LTEEERSIPSEAPKRREKTGPKIVLTGFSFFC